MKRVIFSLYIDIPLNELDYQPPYPGDTISKTERTKIVMADNFSFLQEQQIKYAEKCGVDYCLYLNDNKWKEYHTWWKENHPYITTYNIVNFYKLKILYDLAEEYDEILYLDFDVIPVTNDNFFKRFNLKKGLAIVLNEDKEYNHFDTSSDAILYLQRVGERFRLKKGFSNRAPEAKYWNSMALNLIRLGDSIGFSYNTGIIGVNKEHLNQLDYWSDLEEILEDMSDLKDDEMFPWYIREIFGWDNETIFGHKVLANNVKTQHLGRFWHFRYWDAPVIPKRAKFIHVLNKDFDTVKHWMVENEKINL